MTRPILGPLGDKDLERVVEQAVVLPLLHWLGWDPADISREVAIRIGREKKVYARADVVVRERGTTAAQNAVVVEAKRPGENLGAAVAQAHTYATSLTCPLFVVTDGLQLQVWAATPQRSVYRNILNCAVADVSSFTWELGVLLGAATQDRATVAQHLPDHPVLSSYRTRGVVPTDLRDRAALATFYQDADTLTDLLHTYMRLKSSRRGRTSALTLRAYAESARRFLDFCGPPESPSRSLNQLTPEDFELWMLQLQAEGLSPNSVKRHLYGARTLMKALVWSGALKIDPSQGVSPPSDPTPAHSKKQALSVEQLPQLLSLPAAMHADDSIRARRDLVLLLLGSAAGLRAAEIVGLRADDVDLAGAKLNVAGKGGKRRTVPLGRSLAAALPAWLIARATLQAEQVLHTHALLVSLSGINYGGQLTTDGARHIARAYYQALGLAPNLWGLHTLRRTAGTHLFYTAPPVTCTWSPTSWGIRQSPPALSMPRWTARCDVRPLSAWKPSANRRGWNSLPLPEPGLGHVVRLGFVDITLGPHSPQRQ